MVWSAGEESDINNAFGQAIVKPLKRFKMDLNFTKQAEGWVAEFAASSDFNLHIEGVKEGNVKVYQRGTARGRYAYVRAATPYPSFDTVYDFDFSALVYPKYIKVVCNEEPTKAVVTE